MFPSFLDGAATTTPPELLDRVREVPRPEVDRSFESHLHRTQDVAEAKPETTETNSAEEAPDDPAGDAVVNEGEAEANQSSQEDATSATEEADSSQDAENDHGEDESAATESNLKDELLTAEVDVLLETVDATEVAPLEDLAPTELADPVLEDKTPTLVAVEDTADVEVSSETVDSLDLLTPEALPKNGQVEAVSENETQGVKVEVVADSTEQVVSEDFGPDVPLSDRVVEDGSGRKDATNSLKVANDAEEPSATSERPAADPKKAEGEAAVAANTPSDGDVQTNFGGETQDETPRERHHGHLATSKRDDGEAGVVSKQVNSTAAALLTALAPETEAKSDGRADVEKGPSTAALVDGKADVAVTSPQSRFAQQLSTASGERTSRNDPTTDINQTRFVDRVARAFRATNGLGGTIKLRLHPPELGVLQVHMKVQGNALTAKLEAETPAARALLIDSLPVLRERLADLGIRVEQFDIDLMERQPQNLPDQTGEGSGDEQNDDGASQVEAGPDEPSSGTSRRGSGGDDQQLDVTV